MADALSRSVVTDDNSIERSRFYVFDKDDDDDDPDWEPPVEPASDGTAPVESYSDEVSILAKIEIGAGQTRNLLTDLTIDEFRDA